MSRGIVLTDLVDDKIIQNVYINTEPKNSQGDILPWRYFLKNSRDDHNLLLENQGAIVEHQPLYYFLLHEFQHIFGFSHQDKLDSLFYEKLTPQNKEIFGSLVYSDISKIVPSDTARVGIGV